ncbi:zinc finger protein ZXDC [Microcaecilia unicolor]|uniref:Zinc finger protein ZXDC n=1 Tax=Microcaecilia unicolor TaxID=1415580 RepID=A0A6P7YE68_9AMPH|nr:zinc finger protein ZXDC [Microcaecilia unicolor]
MDLQAAPARGEGNQHGGRGGTSGAPDNQQPPPQQDGGEPAPGTFFVLINVVREAAEGGSEPPPQQPEEAQSPKLLVRLEDAAEPQARELDEAAGVLLSDTLEGQLANFLLSEPTARRGGGELVLVYRCPEPACGSSFLRKRQLKLHLVSHARALRPYKCNREGCAWAFATSYKLKRHLQSHDKRRPFPCQAPGCTKSFTTVYNLKAHARMHEAGSGRKCEACGQRYPSAARLAAHQRSHFEPQRPYTCQFPGCEKTFITVSALFSHNRVHFREQEPFSCSFPGCTKQYDKACRLKIHLRTHTGERPFVCDFSGCGWSFTSMSKLLRHKRKHEDDRRFTCPVEGCGKSFTRADHLKGHSITHLGTKPFECPIEGCCAKFAARSSLYIHSKKHLQDVEAVKSRCPISSCNKLFTSKHSIKKHMVKQHNFSFDLLSQLEATSSLTPSSELANSGQNDLGNLDLASLFSSVPGNNSGIATDMTLVNSEVLTIDVSSVGSTLGGNISISNHSLGQTVDPLVLVTSSDAPHSLDSSLLLGTAATVLQQNTLNLDDVQTVNAQVLGSLASLSMRSSTQDLQGLPSSTNLTVDTATLTPSSSLSGSSSMPEAQTPVKVERNPGCSTDVAGVQEGSKVLTQFVFASPAGTYSAQELDLSTLTGSSILESGGSARTDYRAIQLAKTQKQMGNSSTGSSYLSQRKSKSEKVSPASASSGFCSTVVVPSTGSTIRDSTAGTQYVQIQLLQDDPPGEGDLPFHLGTQVSTSHSQLTVDLPVHILQDAHTPAEDDAGSDNSQFTGSTINLQDLE